MKLIMTKLYLRDSGIKDTTTSLLWISYHLLFCSTLNKSAVDAENASRKYKAILCLINSSSDSGFNKK